MKGLLKNNFLTVYSNEKVFSIFMLILGLFVVAVISQPLLIGYVLLSMVGFSVNAITSIKRAYFKVGKIQINFACKESYYCEKLFYQSTNMAACWNTICRNRYKFIMGIAWLSL